MVFGRKTNPQSKQINKHHVYRDSLSFENGTTGFFRLIYSAPFWSLCRLSCLFSPFSGKEMTRMVERSSVTGSEGCDVSRGGCLREHWGMLEWLGDAVKCKENSWGMWLWKYCRGLCMVVGKEFFERPQEKCCSNIGWGCYWNQAGRHSGVKKLSFTIDCRQWR